MAEAFGPYHDRCEIIDPREGKLARMIRRVDWAELAYRAVTVAAFAGIGVMLAWRG